MADAETLQPQTRRGTAEPAARAVLAAVVVGALYVGRSVLAPLVLAALLGFLLAPPVRFLRARGLGRAASAFSVVAIVFLIVASLTFIAGREVSLLSGNAVSYETTLRAKIASLRDMAAGALGSAPGKILKELGGDAPVSTQPQGAPAEAAAPAAAEPLKVQQASSIFDTAQSVLGPVLGWLASAGAVLVFVIVGLIQREDLRDRFIRLTGANDLTLATTAINEAARRLSRLFLMQTLLNAAFGLFMGAGLWALGVPSPVLWAVLAFLMRFVPFVGAPLAAVLPICLAAVIAPGWHLAVYTAALFLAADLFVSQVLEPLLYSKSTGLSPVAVIIAAAFWTWLWGVPGLLLSTPVTVCLATLGRHVGSLGFLDVLLSGAPALTPPQRFYQRMLAGDPIEAAEQAEDYIGEHGAAAYYDDVLLKGLELAMRDMRLGRLPAERLREIRGTTLELIEEVRGDDGPGDGPAQGPAARRVICVSGRNPLDEPLAAALADLLRRGGAMAVVKPIDGASAVAEGADTVVLVSLSVGSSAAYQKFLTRRLMSLFPRAPLIGAFLGEQTDTAASAGVPAAIGAERRATSLRAACDLCLAETAAEAQPQAVIAKAS